MKTAVQNLNVQKWVLSVAIILFIVKIFAFYLTRSIAVLSDALESIVNIIAAVITFISLWIASKPSDADHPYGHGKAEFLAAGVEGVLIVIAAVTILFKSIQSFIDPHLISSLEKGILLIAFTALANWVMGYICIQNGKKNHSLALMASGKHLQTDTYSTLAVVLSLVLMYFFKWPMIDAIVSLLLSFFIGFTGYKILKSSIAGIMDKTDVEVIDKIIQEVNKARKYDWIDLHNLRVIKYGSTYHIDCHFTLPWYYTVKEAHQEVDELLETIRNFSEQPVEFMVHIDDCRPASCKICQKMDCHVRQHPFEKQIEWNFKSVTTSSRHYLSTK